MLRDAVPGLLFCLIVYSLGFYSDILGFFVLGIGLDL
jgi:hypothetical protein